MIGTGTGGTRTIDRMCITAVDLPEPVLHETIKVMCGLNKPIGIFRVSLFYRG